MSHADIELILVDPNEALCREWRHAFEKSPRCIGRLRTFENCRSSTVWSVAANSFGLDDEGDDLAITQVLRCSS